MDTKKLVTSVIDVKIKGKKIWKVSMYKVIVSTTIISMFIFSIILSDVVLSMPEANITVVDGKIEFAWGFYDANGGMSVAGIVILIFFFVMAVMFSFTIYVAYNKAIKTIDGKKDVWIARFCLFYLMALICILMICGWAQHDHTVKNINGINELSWMFIVHSPSSVDGVVKLWLTYSDGASGLIAFVVLAYVALALTCVIRYFHIHKHIQFVPVKQN